MVCIRGPNRFDEKSAEDDLEVLKKKSTESDATTASKEVRVLANKMQMDFDKVKHAQSGHAAR